MKQVSERMATTYRYEVSINGQPAKVHMCQDVSYVIADSADTMNVEVKVSAPFETVTIRPLQEGIEYATEGMSIAFQAEPGAKLSVELNGSLHSPLFLLTSLPEEDKPQPDDPGVIYFAGGQTYEVGEIKLNSGETVYIEEGAVVYGILSAHGAERIRVAGRGILDGSKWRGFPKKPYEERSQMIRFIECGHVEIEGITIVDGANWHVVPIACKDVRISNINIITFEGTGDGIDIVGCKDVLVEKCFIRSNDDCVAMKGNDYHHPAGCADIERVRVKNCVFWNAPWGNAIEIGYETRCEFIRDIVVENCDVIHCELEGWQSGGVFTIHNGDRATVSGVLYDRIRVEDAQEKLFDMKIQHSVYSKDAERGQIRDITFRDIEVIGGQFPVSIIRGFDADHVIERITFERLTILGQPIASANEARMVVEIAKDVRFTG